MKSQIIGLRVASAIFGLMALGQLLRLGTGFGLIVAGYAVPFWASAVVLVIAGGLSLWLWKLSKGGISR